MPSRKVINRARKDAREGKAPSTQAGEFVREEMEHVRRGKHGASSPKQAIAIGLSKARQAGVRIPARGKSRKKQTTARRKQAAPSARRRGATARKQATRKGAHARHRRAA